PSDLINAGNYVFEPSVLDRIPADRPASIERETFPALVDDGGLYALAFDAYWIDAGTPEQYLRANLDLVRGCRIGPPAPDAVDDGTGVWTRGGPVIDGEVVAPALIGDAALVERGARVEDAVVGAGARVLAGAVVRES